MEDVKDLLTSKKFWMTVIGVVVTVIITAVPALEQYQEQLPEMIWLFVAYLLAQGMADFGKHSE
ncbi:MAG: hypothetical protein GY938_12705 [Ketobacter sp.]|nr:hypothetical protein [Ketobacter sp.]